jgi:hypothetical protein
MEADNAAAGEVDIEPAAGTSLGAVISSVINATISRVIENQGSDLAAGEAKADLATTTSFGAPPLGLLDNQGVDLSQDNITAVVRDPQGDFCIMCMYAHVPGAGVAWILVLPLCTSTTSVSCRMCGHQTVIPLSTVMLERLLRWHDQATGRELGED